MDPLLGNCSLAALRQRRSFKWRTYPPDVLPAFVAEMDFDLAQPVKDAVTQALAGNDCGYPHRGALGEAYAGFSAARSGWAPDPAMVYPVPDVMTGVAEVLTAVTPPGAGVVINPPVYAPFFFRLELLGRQVVQAPLRRDAADEYDLDLDALDRALSADGVAAYLLCSPHNPLGRVWSAGQLTAIADACQRHGVWLLADEIHAPLALPGAAHVPFLSLGHPQAQRTISFTSASKGWNIAGLKCGVAVAGSPEGAALLEQRWEALLADHLCVGGAPAALSPGPDFGPQGAGFARLNIGTYPELITEAVRRMAAAVPAQVRGRRSKEDT